MTCIVSCTALPLDCNGGRAACSDHEPCPPAGRGGMPQTCQRTPHLFLAVTYTIHAAAPDMKMMCEVNLFFFINIRQQPSRQIFFFKYHLVLDLDSIVKLKTRFWKNAK